MNSVKFIGTALLVLCALFQPVTHAREREQNLLSVKENVVDVNPISMPFGTVNVGIERAIGWQPSLWANAWLEYRDIKEGRLLGELKLYTSGRHFDGFSIGFTAGVHRSYREGDAAGKLDHDTAPVVGAVVQYNWVVDGAQRFPIGAGLSTSVALKAIPGSSLFRRVDGAARLVTGW